MLYSTNRRAVPKSIQEAKTSRRNCLEKATNNSTKSRNEVPTFLFMCALAGVTFGENLPDTTSQNYATDFRVSKKPGNPSVSSLNRSSQA